MPTTPTPYIRPNTLKFKLSGCPQTLAFCVFNPFPHDILFKVDNPRPEDFTVLPTQGVISSQNKIQIQLTCTSRVVTQDYGVQVRFFKCAKPRHGQRRSTQQYVGYREVKICIDHDERERTLTDHGSVSFSAIIPSSGPGDRSSKGSISRAPFSDTGSVVDEVTQGVKRKQVVYNLVIALALFVCGLILNQTSEELFSHHVLEGVKPQTLAIISYTLGVVVILKLLTLR